MSGTVLSDLEPLYSVYLPSNDLPVSTILCVQNVSIVKLLLTVSLNVQLPGRRPWLHSSQPQAGKHYLGQAPYMEPRGLECPLWERLLGQTQHLLQRKSRPWTQTCFLSIAAEPQPRPWPEPRPPWTRPLPPSQPPVRFLTLSSPVLFGTPHSSSLWAQINKWNASFIPSPPTPFFSIP